MNIEYVKCIKAWHDNVKVTIGKIYYLKHFIDDTGKFYDLNKNYHGNWRKEFDISTEYEYNKQQGIINKQYNYYY